MHISVGLEIFRWKAAPSLTLLGPEGGTLCPPCHVFVYNGANTRTSVLKNLILPNYEFGKGQYAFYPMKLLRFSEKIEFVGNTEIS